MEKTDNIVSDMQSITDASHKQAFHAVNTALVQRNCLIGYHIAKEELNGKGFIKTNLYSFYSFYRCFPEIFHTVCGKSAGLLSWSHYRCLIQVKKEAARKWYEKEAYGILQ